MYKMIKDFFYKEPIWNLGVARILFYGALLKEVWARDYLVKVFYHWQLVPKEIWTPVGIFNFLPSSFFLSAAESYILLNLLCLSAFFCMIGFLTRLSALVSFVSALLLFGYPNNFGTVWDSDCLILVTMFILIFSNMSRSLSLDSFFARKKSKPKNETFDQLWNLWTIKLIITLTCLFYFTSGIQKIRLGGWDWAFSNHMAISFVDMGHPWGGILSQFTILCYIIIWLGLLSQIISFIPILYEKSITFFLVLFILFHFILDVTLGSHFDRHFMVLIFLVPWGNVVSTLPGQFKGRFWPIAASFITQKINLKKKAILVMLFLIGCFVISMSLYAPYSLQHLYPFSTTTMYAWIDKEPIKRRFIFVTEADNQKRRIVKDEIWPIASSKLFSKFKALEKQEDGKEKIHLILQQIKNRQSIYNRGMTSLKFIKKISLEYCFWKTTDDYIHRPKQPDRCEIFIEKEF